MAKLIRRDKATPRVLTTINRVSEKLTTEAYNEMAIATTVEGEAPSAAAHQFLDANNLPKEGR